MKYPNLYINPQNGSLNRISPTTVKPPVWVRLWAWLSNSVPDPVTYYDLYFKASFPKETEIRKGAVYLDKASAKKLVVLSIVSVGRTKRKYVQFRTLFQIKESDKSKINLPLCLKYAGR